MISKNEYETAIEQKKVLETLINTYHKEQDDIFNQRLKDNPIFIDEELYYAATNRCPCGAGLAYPKACSAYHYWDCSAILKGIADSNVQHIDRLPFNCYNIKSENQLSSKGVTTRP